MDRVLSNKEVLKRLVIMPGIPNAIFGLFVAFFLVAWLNAIDVSVSFMSITLTTTILAVIGATLIVITLPAIWVVGDFLSTRGKWIHCGGCGEIRSPQAIEMERVEAQQERCSSCHHPSG